MHILLVYATNSGATYEATGIVRGVLTDHGNKVTVQHAKDTRPEDLDRPDLVILGSCTWESFVAGTRLEGRLQQHMQALTDDLRQRQYTGQRFAVFGLGDHSFTNFCGAADHLETVVEDVGGRQLGPTLRIDRYYFNLDHNRRQVLDWAEQINQALTT